MSNPGREAGWTLRQRLQLIITLALIPVIMVSLFQGVARARLDIANVHDRLIQSARTVAAGDQNLLARRRTGAARGAAACRKCAA